MVAAKKEPSARNCKMTQTGKSVMVVQASVKRVLKYIIQIKKAKSLRWKGISFILVYIMFIS